MACVLGAGVGLWARPGDHERPGAPQKAQPTALPVKAPRRLAIIVDDSPAPLGKPLDVLTRPEPRPAIVTAAPPPSEAEPVAPSRPPNGLVRVVAPVPGQLAPTLGHPAPPPVPAPVVAAPRPVKVEAIAAPPRAKAAPKVVKPNPAKLEAAKLQKAALRAKPDKRPAPQTKVAEAPPARPRHGLSQIAHVFAKLAPHHAKTPPEARAEAKPHRSKKAETRLATAAPRHAKPESTAPIKVANLQTRCASSDPGEALACGDPGLNAAERRLTRAYRDAEAAGVPTSTLERQQQRWKAARAAAAREAPWAVRQVYQARIAELQDLARDARGN